MNDRHDNPDPLLLTEQAVETARSYFLTEENIYGCAETTFMVLKQAYDLPDPGDASAAMKAARSLWFGVPPHHTTPRGEGQGPQRVRPRSPLSRSSWIAESRTGTGGSGDPPRARGGDPPGAANGLRPLVPDWPPDARPGLPNPGHGPADLAIPWERLGICSVRGSRL